jgi:hypothetical protein
MDLFDISPPPTCKKLNKLFLSISTFYSSPAVIRTGYGEKSSRIPKGFVVNIEFFLSISPNLFLLVLLFVLIEKGA